MELNHEICAAPEDKCLSPVAPVLLLEHIPSTGFAKLALFSLMSGNFMVNRKVFGEIFAIPLLRPKA